MKNVFSGIQPTGAIHIGNYIGAVARWIDMQNNKDFNNIFCIVDLHAITLYQDPKDLKDNSLKMLSFILASGIDPEKSTLFLQSNNIYHSELSWILNCIARIGWLSRMTQFKEKTGKHKEKSSVGLYAYPILQAADILLYDTDIVPVGEDQKQHIELARDISQKFNNDYGETFKLPEPFILEGTGRIMSLKDASKKMSKSDANEGSKILFTDSDDAIIQKIRKAKTDSLPMPVSYEEAKERKEIFNLLNIYSFFANKDIDSILQDYQNQGFANFKSDLGDILVNHISEIRKRQIELLNNKDHLMNVLEKGKQRTLEIAYNKMLKVKKAIGFIN